MKNDSSELAMRCRLTQVSKSMDWVTVALVLLLLAILLVMTLPLWTPDLFGHLWH